MESPETEIRLQFLRHGVRSARDLMEATNLSQPTISRYLSHARDSVVRIGRARSTQYGLAAPIGNLGSKWPLFLIDETGNPEQIGNLHALTGRAWYLERTAQSAWSTLTGDEFPEGIFPDLPWFLDDARPQGFLGRAFAQTHGPTLGESRDPTVWSSAGVVEGLLRFGGDVPGALVLGRDALAMALRARCRNRSHG